MAFPAFQLDAGIGRPYDVVPAVLNAFAIAGVDPYSVAAWLATAQDQIDGGSPAVLRADPATASKVQAAAERTAARREPQTPPPSADSCRRLIRLRQLSLTSWPRRRRFGLTGRRGTT